MYRVGKICVYNIISLLVSIMVHFGSHSFFDTFINALIPLLATLSAIYMTANSLVVIEINKFKDKYPSADSKPTICVIKKIFITQIILILVLIISFIIRDLFLSIEFEIKYFKEVIEILSNAFAIAVFGYFLEAIYDMGQTLFSLIDFNNKDK